MNEFDLVRFEAEELVRLDSDRNTMFAEILDIFNMEWRNEPKLAETRTMVSPDGHNTIRGMVNILMGNEPKLTITFDKGNESLANDVERWLLALYKRIGMLRGSPVSYDMTLAGSIFDIMPLKLASTTATADNLAERAKEAKKEDKKIMERQAKYYRELPCPFMVDVLNPASIHVKRGMDGIRCVVENRIRYTYDIRAEFGQSACEGMSETEEVEYWEYWDRYRYFKWVGDKILAEGTYEGPFPYIIHEVNGTRLFGRTQLYPVLFPIWRGDIWEAQNRSLTMMNSNVFALGNPQWVVITQDGRSVEINADLAGGQILMKPGESIYPLTKDLVPGELRAFLAEVNSLSEQSTINKMVFGKAPENVLAYSTVNMLVQGARHTIVALQVAASNTLTELFTKMLQWAKNNGEKLTLMVEGKELVLDPKDIPDSFGLEAKLEPDLPQDRLQLANMAKMLLDSGILSRSSATELTGKDPKEEADLIAREKIFDLLLQLELQKAAKQMEPEPQETQGPPPPEQGFIPPPNVGQSQDVAPDVMPPVQLEGAPTPEFQQSAAQNMEGAMPYQGE